MTFRTVRAAVLGIAVWLSFWPAAWGFAYAEVGSVIENAEMPSIEGGRRRLLSYAAVNVFIFFKPGQEHSRATMKKIAEVEKETAGKSVHWVGIVSDGVPREEVLAEVMEAGIAMPVLVDVGDALYGRLGVALQPVVGITDKDGKLAAYQPFTKIHFTEVLRARIRHMLKEIDERELARALHPSAAAMDDGAAAARRRLTLAEQLFRGNHLEKALENVNIGIEKNERSATAHSLRGDILTAKGACAEALQSYERALAIEPSDPRALAGKKACEGK